MATTALHRTQKWMYRLSQKMSPLLNQFQQMKTCFGTPRVDADTMDTDTELGTSQTASNCQPRNHQNTDDKHNMHHFKLSTFR